jgi:hypothetical protein
LFSIFERKTAFLVIYVKARKCPKPPVFSPFLYIPGGRGVYLTPFNITVRLDKISDVMATDGVHYSQLGYKNITTACFGSASLLHGRTANPLSSVTGKGKSHYWRGFRSPVGASACHDMRSCGHACTAQRGRGHWQRPFHPYRR